MTEKRRQRIIFITRNLPPLVGGMERLNWHMLEELVRCMDVWVIGPQGAAPLAPEGAVVSEVPLKPLWKFLLQATARALRLVRRVRPDVVIAGSGLTAPIALLVARVSGARSVVYVHGLDVAVSHPVYRLIWLPALRRVDRVIANSRATASLAEQAGVTPANIGIVHPGVSLPEGEVCQQRVARVLHTYGLEGRTVLLSVGRLSTRKGLREFVAQSLPRIAERCPNVVLAVVGEVPHHALHVQAQTPESIRLEAERVGMADHLRFLGQFLGKLQDSELSLIYQVASVHVFPVREIPGDPEGFGMVAVEAAAYGLPTVAFATGGIVDAVAEGESGALISPGHYLELADAVLNVIASREAFRTSCRAFAKRFEWSAFGEHIIRQIQR